MVVLTEKGYLNKDKKGVEKSQADKYGVHVPGIRTWDESLYEEVEEQWGSQQDWLRRVSVEFREAKVELYGRGK